MKLGEIISSTRKSKGYKQGFIANKIGVTQTYLSQIEKDKKEPTLSLLKKIASSLEIPLPIMFFLALEEEDIPEKKREIFGEIFPQTQQVILSALLK